MSQSGCRIKTILGVAYSNSRPGAAIENPGAGPGSVCFGASVFCQSQPIAAMMAVASAVNASACSSVSFLPRCART